MAFLHWQATAFPVDDPIDVVDEPLIRRLRAEPGLHLALAPQHRLEVSLDLRDDPVNRAVYGTQVDLREVRDERAIHIQVKNGRGAIHADGHNPKAGIMAWLVHATIDVPFTPLLGVFVFGVWLSATGARARGRASRGAPPAGPPSPAT